MKKHCYKKVTNNYKSNDSHFNRTENYECVTRLYEHLQHSQKLPFWNSFRQTQTQLHTYTYPLLTKNNRTHENTFQ